MSVRFRGFGVERLHCSEFDGSRFGSYESCTRVPTEGLGFISSSTSALGTVLWLRAKEVLRLATLRPVDDNPKDSKHADETRRPQSLSQNPKS